MNTALLAGIGADPAFQTTAAPYLVLDTELRIHAANTAYTTATLTTADDLVGIGLFDALPDNPADPDADGVATLSGSLEQVLHRGGRHAMGLQRYDVLAPGDRNRFVRKVWAPVNAPLRDADGRIAGILHHVEDVTEVDRLLRDEPEHQARTADWWHAQPERFTRALVAMSRLGQAHRAVLRENQDLREALHTRGIIEQAKGILIGQRGCGPGDAFAILVELSQHTNTKLHDVARALVRDALQHDPGHPAFEPRLLASSAPSRHEQDGIRFS
ncbi:ANTAR domain-containing protein [Lentzea sp. HUAS12]|uniref:ANTAR domain-containing protein n=1 Tax=Lentzea sp. HUAS12 TaxID=2951806 RepID=UPI00209E4BFA|nr:ANTAR domain-containing protein [Lentzea sp. HUAS12]USX55154.1 ANTAR domain-containing protein [Lentzea sp. HUAS12]